MALGSMEPKSSTGMKAASHDWMKVERLSVLKSKGGKIYFANLFAAVYRLKYPLETVEQLLG